MSKSSTTWRWLLALFLVTLVIFGYSAAVRWQYLDDMGTWNLQWLTSFTVKVVRNWLNDGAIADRFLMLENPASIEFSSLVDRTCYVSYPPGAAIPIWILAKLLSLTTVDELVSLVHSFNLFSQFLIALFLSFSTYLILTRNKVQALRSFSLSIAVSAGWLLLPGQMWWGQQVYFSDQAVILPVALLIFLEVLRTGESGKATKLLNWLIACTSFLACFTDWYGLVFVGMLFLKRITQGEYAGISWKRRLGRALGFWVAPIFSLGLWMYQVILSQGFAGVLHKLAARTYGVQDEWCRNPITVWMPEYYSRVGVAFIFLIFILVVFVIFYLIRQRNTKRANLASIHDIASFMFLIVFSCFFHLALLWQHACQHPFSMFKFGLPLAMVGLGLAPACLWLLYQDYAENHSVRWSITDAREVITCAFLVFSCFFIMFMYPSWKNMGYLEFVNENSQRWIIEDTLDTLTSYEDVVFSTDYEIPALPPVQVARSAKRVYLAEDYATMHAILDPIEGDYNVCLLVPTDDPGWMNWAFELEHKAFSVGEDYMLIRIDKAEWLVYLGAVGS